MKEILKNLVETTTLPEDSYLDQDAEILEIFVEEIEEIFAELNSLFTGWLQAPHNPDMLTTIRRHFHTLKGSGRMVGAKSAGETAWMVEDALNRVISGALALTPVIQKYAQAVLNVYQYKLYPRFKAVEELDVDLRPLVLLGLQLQQGLSPEPALEELLSLADTLTAADGITGLELAEAAAPAGQAASAGEESYIEETVSIFIEEAEERRAPIERFIDRFSRIYTPAIMAVALLVTLVPPLLFAASWQEWIYKGLTLLLIGCPCALVISTPAAITSGLAAAARRGALIKGGAALEQLGRVTQVAFDKTGTLTIGKPRVTAIHPASGIGEAELLALAAAVEQGATHPLAQAIVREAQTRELTIPVAREQRALVGSGIEALVNGERVLICAAGKQPADAFAGQISELESAGQTVVLVLRNDTVLGVLALQDTLRDDARSAISELNQIGVKGVILTGDNPRAAAAIAGELGLEFKVGLLPEDKVQAVTHLNQQSPLAMVGDGINDAPAMKAATIGIAMGSGTDVALETADAALTHNRLRGLVQMIQLARATHANIRQNIAIALGLKGIFLVTTLLGITGLWLAVLADTGATVLVTANALRLLRKG